MGKHRKPSATVRPVRQALFAGALTAGAATTAAIPAVAAPVDTPFGTIEVPDEIAGAIQSIQPPAAPGAPAPFAAPQIAAPPIETIAQRAVDAAMAQVGKPYVYGANGPNAFDCSGLMQFAYQQAGLSIPRTSYDQARAGSPVSLSSLQPGDVVSFYNGGHSAMYIGNGMVVHASTSGVPVKTAPLSSMPADGAVRF